MAARNFPTIPTGQLSATHQNSMARWWHIHSESQMIAFIDDNGDYLTLEQGNLENYRPTALQLKAKPMRLMFENYGLNFIPTEDIGDDDNLWEAQGLNYLTNRIYFVEEDACPKWKKFDTTNATWEEWFLRWRAIGKVIRQFGVQFGSDQYEEYFVDEVERNHKTRTQIYEQIQILEEKKATLTGKENKKKRNSTNKKIKELRKNARALPFAPKISLNKEAPDFQIRRKLFLETEKEKSFHHCSWCKKGMQNWKGCPCKTAWYCNEQCQLKHWKKGKHKKVCPYGKGKKRQKAKTNSTDGCKQQ